LSDFDIGGDGGYGAGGGLYVAGGTVHVNQSTVANNGAYGGRGGDGLVYSGAATSGGRPWWRHDRERRLTGGSDNPLPPACCECRTRAVCFRPWPKRPAPCRRSTRRGRTRRGSRWRWWAARWCRWTRRGLRAARP